MGNGLGKGLCEERQKVTCGTGLYRYRAVNLPAVTLRMARTRRLHVLLRCKAGSG